MAGPKVERSVSTLFDEADRARLRALRKRDPEANLLERWEKVAAARPEMVASRLGYVPKIIEHRWAVIAIPEESFAYTIGLRYRFDQPELLVAAPGRSLGELQTLLNTIAIYVSLGNRIGAGEPVELSDLGLSLTFQPYSAEIFDRFPTGYLATFERFFEDVQHTTGETLPVLWAELAAVEKRRAKKKGRAKKAPAKKKGAPTTRGAKKASAKKKPVKKSARKKPAAKKRGVKKTKRR